MGIQQVKGKYVRDPVHGDIFIESKFLDIIDTPEFQRLRRIKQLSTAYLVFPSADHSRFSHSIGTFYVMKRLLNHFRPLLEGIGVQIVKREEDLALAAALLHDLGHGPFSHAFENALPMKKQKKHEEWTIDIISSSESEVNKALVSNFDSDFPKDVAELFKKGQNVKHHREGYEVEEEVNLRFVLSSLISSQLDADRMDYLLRDAFATGVSIGKFDISRLINSLTLTVYNDAYYVCAIEKCLPTIEEYVLARFHMYESVYYHNFKCKAELLVKKILHRAYELFADDGLDVSTLPEGLFSIFRGEEMSVGGYCSLDDSVLVALFDKWRSSNDRVLSRLCNSFLDRDKFTKLFLLDNEEKDVSDFLRNLAALLEVDTKELTEGYYWLSGTNTIKSYKDRKENIWILRGNGVVSDIAELSKMATPELSRRKTFAYMDFGLLENAFDLKNDGALNEVKNLLNMYDSRNHIEIEKKYNLINEETFKLLCDELNCLTNYEVVPLDAERQRDRYYETPEKVLLNTNRTIRVREKGKKFTLTIKTPTLPSSVKTSSSSQNERFEYEKRIDTCDIHDHLDFLKKHVPDLENKFDELSSILIIENDRKRLGLKRGNVIFEVSLDTIYYKGDGWSKKEYQAEIELKSDYIHRINLKMLTDYLETKIPNLEPTIESKYVRGLKLAEQVM